MQSVGVLGGVDELDRPVGVEVLGQRELDDEPRAGRILVELADPILEERLVDVGRKVRPDRRDADLLAVAMLAGDIGLAARILADQAPCRGRASRRAP